MNLFIQIFYQPFLNILVAIYYGLKLVMGPEADMGIAVILFTIVIRILMLPLTISGDRSEAEKRRLEEQIGNMRETYATDPVARDANIKLLMKSNKRMVISSSINLGIQTMLALMLWRIFAKGLLGADFHLLYSVIPQPTEPLNLVFLGKYDLTHPNSTLNFLQSALIFILEAEAGLFSPFPVSKKEAMLLQFTLPVVSYIIFSQLPAGKKLFIITTLLFSIGYVTQRQLRFWWHGLTRRLVGGKEAGSVVLSDEAKKTESEEFKTQNSNVKTTT